MSEQVNDDAGAPDGPVVVLDQALWRDLTAPATDAAFGLAWLGLVCRAVPGAGRASLALLSGPGAVPVLCHWPVGAMPDAGLLAAAQAALRAGRGTVQPGATAQAPARLAYVVQSDGASIAACALDLAPGRDPRLAMRQIQWASAWLRDRCGQRALRTARGLTDRTTLALDLLAAALEQDGFAAACRVSATELATRFDCERVAIGFTRRQRSRVAAISHTSQFGQDLSLARLLAEAMDEAIDQQGPVLWPASDDAMLVTRAHEALAAAHASGGVLTVPMFVRDRFAGAVTFERAGQGPGVPAFDQATIDLADAVVAILGPALHDKRDLARPLPMQMAARAAMQAVHLFGPGHWGRKLTLVALATTLAFAWFARGPYRIAADARVEGAVQRAMVAPFDGFIAEADVKAGDTVLAGQRLALLDDRDLVLERLRWLTERQQHEAEYDQSLSQGKRADAARNRAQVDEAQAQVHLLDEQLARTRIVAPFDGIVVSGDLSQQVGAPARRGDVLFEIAPLRDYRVALRVSESQVSDVAPGQSGSLLVAALPDVSLPFTVLRLVPVAEAHDGKMQFRVDARLDASLPRLRPGMEGVGKIDAGQARLVWIWFRSLTYWMRVTGWAWLG